jgi:hypothetical protein
MRIIETSEPYWEIHAADYHSLSNIYPLYHAASIVLVQTPLSKHAHDLFGRAASLLPQYVDDVLSVLHLLQALRSLVVRLRLPLSSIALGLFQMLHLSTAELVTLPAAFVLPASLEILKDMSEGRRLRVN